MYVWCAIEVDDQLLSIRRKIEEIDKCYNLNSPTLTLPFHVSLKISFETESEAYKEIQADLVRYFESIRSFTFDYECVERNDKILWLKVAKNDILSKIHNHLDDFLLSRYGIPFHKFDSCFEFHTSLLISEDTTSMGEAETLFRDTVPMKTVLAKEFVIGTSETGMPGTYRVVKRVTMHDK